MSKAKSQDGETFGLLISNPGLPTPVKLDLRTIEADQVRFVDITLLTVPSVDGIRFDDFGNPVSYHVLRVHPGFWSYATGYIGFPWEYDVWPAKFVLHWFRADRPGQHRGIPEIMAALPLLAQVRRYILATLQASETAADFAMYMKTPTAAEGMIESDEVVEVPNPFDLFPLQRNIVTTLPDGYEIGQTKPNQPIDRIEEFVRVLLRQVARCMNMPYNIVAGDFSQGSYSESNLGNQGYFRQIEEGHKDLEYSMLDRLLAAWLMEASVAQTGGDFGAPYMPASVKAAIGKITGNACDLPNHSYNWVGHEWANPSQAADADQKNLRMGFETYARVWGRKGQDYRKAHISNAKALGLSIEEYREEVLLPNLIEKPQPEPPPPADGAPADGSQPKPGAKPEAAGVEKT
jgi:capsid protein